MAYKRGAKEDILNRPALLPPWPEHKPDLNEGTRWSEMAIEDLHAAWKAGYTLPELAEYLCRDWKEITEKCKELGLDLVKQPQRKTLAKIRKRTG